MGVRVKDEGQFKEIYIKALDSLPVGTSVEYAGTTIPDELKGTWLFERGQELSRTEYAKLFSVIGTSYGVGDGSTTFNLPNKCGKVPVGLDTNDTDFNIIGKTGGSKYLQDHKHKYPTEGGSYIGQINATWSAPLNGGQAIYGQDSPATTGNVLTSGTGSVPTGNSGNLQPYIVKNYIIKVKETRPLASHTVNAYSESESNAYSCDYSNKAFGGTILWTNPSPTSNFSAQDITLSSDDYDCIEIVYEFTRNAGYRQIISTGKIPYSTNGGFMQAVTYGGDKGVIVGVRNISFTNKTTISIQNCNRYWTIGTEIGNDFCIPLYIIGYKTGLFPTQQSTRSLNTYSGDIEEKKEIVIDDGNK